MFNLKWGTKRINDKIAVISSQIHLHARFFVWKNQRENVHTYIHE